MLVLAGPGAGKTYCLIQRVRYLIEHERLEPSRILAVTFTNRAAGEIADRLGQTLGSQAEAVTRGTIHSLCVQLLRSHGEEIGVPSGFGIADDDYQLQALRRAGFRKEGRWPLNAFARYRLQGAPLGEWLTPIYERYRQHLARRNLLDFDDLIAETERLLRTSERAASEIAGRWDYLLIDEAQDLSPVQYQVLSRLAERHRNIFAVGDDEQSIFGFAGADSAVLRRFVNDFGITQAIILDENHRSARQIFEAARRLISRNPQDHPRDLRAMHESPWEVSARAFPDEEAEARWTVAELARDRESSGLAWGEFALLYRRHEVGDLLESRLIEAGIPCQLARGRALSDDPATAYLIAALQVIDEPDDPIRIAQLAWAQLPGPQMAALKAEAERSQVDLLECLKREARLGRTSGEQEGKRLRRFLTDLANLPSLRDRFTTLAPLVEELLSRKVGPQATPLEEKFEEALLTDPLGDPAAVTLAHQLSRARAERSVVWLPEAGGAEFGMAGMLRAGGWQRVSYLTGDATPSATDLVIEPSRRGTLSLAGTLFKAIQVVEARYLTSWLRDFVALDIETTELDVRSAETVELAAVRVREGRIVEQFQRLVRPVHPIAPGTEKVHGIGDADVAGAPGFGEVWKEFMGFAGDDLLVAHNGHYFDFRVLERQCQEAGQPWTAACFDTLPLARDLHAGSGKLVDLAAAFGVDPGRSHRALDDCRTLVEVVRHLEQKRVARARTVSLAGLIDHLAVALAATDRSERSAEDDTLLDAGRIYALGRYTRALELYEAERGRAPEGYAPPLEAILERLGGKRLMAAIQRQKTAGDRYPATMARLRTLLQTLSGTTLREQLAEFLSRVALSTSAAGAETSEDRVNLLTLHATKGLEFSRVFIVGVEDGQLPGAPPGRSPSKADLEEGRRLLYVGMTRARDRLVLTRAARRGGVESGGGRFLSEMDLDLAAPGPDPGAP